MLRPLMLNSLNYFRTKATCSALTESCEKKVAVVLSGCGMQDGSEIHEASSVLVHLTRGGVVPECYAPLALQIHVVDHRKGTLDDSGIVRNVLYESARIARGKISPLKKLSAKKADALVFPGGFGAAKHLSNFAEKGTDCCVFPDVERVMKEFHCAGKPMAFICISPILAAKVFGDVCITLGKKDEDGCKKWPHASAIDAAKTMGATVEEKGVKEFLYDEKNHILTTPAFMYKGKFYEIYDGIGVMIEKLLSLINEPEDEPEE